MKKTPFIRIIAVALTVLFGGCGGPTQTASNGITVMFVPKLTGNAFFEAANEGAQAYAERNGFQVLYRGNPEASVSHQTEIVRGAIAEKVDALCISALDAKGLDEVLKEAKAAGLHVVTWDSDVSGEARTLMVSQGTPDQLGRMLVEMGAKSLSERGKHPSGDVIRYAWHYSQSYVTDQNSWYMAGERYIQNTYPNWVNVAPDNYYSEQNEAKAVQTAHAVFEEHPDIDLIICNDSTALPGQAEAAKERGLKAEDVTITGFASPNAMREYCKLGVVARWGLWDCKTQGALGCYLAYYLASGNRIKVGDQVDVPEIGLLEVMPNTVLDPEAYTAPDSGVVLLPERTEFTIENVDDYNF